MLDWLRLPDQGSQPKKVSGATSVTIRVSHVTKTAPPENTIR